ncbi:MAG: cyclic nucleotide-binding domain-containing protein, partial [Halobacteriales archaeon]|nr:cyclic nucleotide-binding domain-containing protein [Halobacteriales archaeon]
MPSVPPHPPVTNAAVAEWLSAASVETTKFQPGEDLVREGDPSDEVLIITDGTARVSAGDRSHDLAALGAGSVIGEVSALAGGTRTATVTAESVVTAHVLSRQQFQQLLEDDPEFAKRVTREASARLDRRHMLAFLERLLGHL